MKNSLLQQYHKVKEALSGKKLEFKTIEMDGVGNLHIIFTNGEGIHVKAKSDFQFISHASYLDHLPKDE